MQIKIGELFGRLAVIREVEGRREPGGQLRRYMLCRCECGNEKEIKLDFLRSGKTTSCGCARIKHKIAPGMVFGSWTVVSAAGSNRHGQRLFLCRCRCGRESVLPADRLVNGKSCLSCARRKDGTIISGGYRMVYPQYGFPYPEMATKSGRVMEHRMVKAIERGRALLPTETVHHINGDRLDNRPENLQLMHGSHSSGVLMQCNDCGSNDVGHAPLNTETFDYEDFRRWREFNCGNAGVNLTRHDYEQHIADGEWVPLSLAIAEVRQLEGLDERAGNRQ